MGTSWSRPDPHARVSDHAGGKANVSDLRRSKSAGLRRGDSPNEMRDSQGKVRPKSAVGSPTRAIDRHRESTILVYHKATEKLVPLTAAAAAREAEKQRAIYDKR
jgi:hypothetical protein